jgi:hypothetical protein
MFIMPLSHDRSNMIETGSDRPHSDQNQMASQWFGVSFPWPNLPEPDAHFADAFSANRCDLWRALSCGFSAVVIVKRTAPHD